MSRLASPQPSACPFTTATARDRERLTTRRMQSRATTVAAYLDELPPERRAVVATVRDLVLRHLPAGYQETMASGMIGYGISLADYPNTYNKQPLAYVGLAAQKRHYALYLMNVHQNGDDETRLREAFARAGKTLDMGESCLRFTSLDDLELDAVAEVIASTPPAALIARYEALRGQSRAR